MWNVQAIRLCRAGTYDPPRCLLYNWNSKWRPSTAFSWWYKRFYTQPAQAVPAIKAGSNIAAPSMQTKCTIKCIRMWFSWSPCLLSCIATLLRYLKIICEFCGNLCWFLLVLFSWLYNLDPDSITLTPDPDSHSLNITPTKTLML